MKSLPLNSILMGVVIFLGACNSKNDDSDFKKFNGGNHVVRIAEVISPTSLFPPKITNVVEALITSQIHEGLVKINPKDLTLLPGLAGKWEVNATKNEIVFNLRKNLKFQNKDGVHANITSKDVKFTFELLCSKTSDNLYFQNICKDRIVGANEFYEASSSAKRIPLKGFRIIDDYTFSVELYNSPYIFLQILSNPFAAIICEQAYNLKKEKLTIGAGPFIFDDKASTKNHYVLYKNVNYYGVDSKGVALPYLDSLIIDIVPSMDIALQKFQNGNIDFISSVPDYEIKQIVTNKIKSFTKSPPDFFLDQQPEMASAYYSFNLHKPPFNNVKVRQAINYAIDRRKIIDRFINGQAYVNKLNGVVPPVFDYYNTQKIKGYNFDLVKAKKLLAEAGYENGKGFPEIQLIVNMEHARNTNVAAEIQKQLKNNLNINLTFESLPNTEKLDLQVHGKGDLFRDGWVADYPNPESFLSVFYSGTLDKGDKNISYPNINKYKNADFNKYYEKGRDVTSRDSSAIYFLKAEQILMDESAVMVLWYASDCRLIKTRLKDFNLNPIRYFDFSQVSVADKK